MINDDVALIQRILADDEAAFAALVKRYQKAVHTLAWRKIGDFHIAEDITQDAFLKVYQKLHTLKDPNQFAGWLYVITSNLCSTWLRKKRIQTQPLEDADTTMMPRDVYSQHVVEERKNTAVESQREVVKKLLAKLKESERIVMSLHYLGEMKIEEISRFLGVSTSTIKSRLRRARNRLQQEETMIREALEHFQLSPNLTDNIMQEVNRLKPTAPSASNPLVPWAIAAASAVILVLLLGIGSQQLLRFQQPYNLDAQAEMTVELIDTPVVLNVDNRPGVRIQLGNSNPLGISENDGQNPDEVLIAAAETEADEKLSATKQQWVQRNAPVGSGHDMTLFQTQGREVYYFPPGRRGKLHKLHAEGNEWQPVFDVTSLQAEHSADFFMVELNDTFYIVLDYYLVDADRKRIIGNKLYRSSDGGKTWSLVGRCPDGWVADFEVIDDRFYLIVEKKLEKKLFVSKDIGKTWSVLDDGFPWEVNAVQVIQNMLLAATDRGLYHIDGESLQRLQFPIDEVKKVTEVASIAGTENSLYALTASDWENVGQQEQTWWLYRSTDKGQSWIDISPTNALHIIGYDSYENRPEATLVAVKNTVLLIGWDGAAVVRSVDNGDTWTLEKTSNIPLMPYSVQNAVAVDENTFYLQGHSGMYRSIDGGISWTRLDLETRGSIIDLICVNTSKEHYTSGFLYALFSGGVYFWGKPDTWVFKSSDKGKSWHVVNPELQPQKDIPSFTRILESDGVIYVKSQGPSSSAIMGLCRLSEDRKTFVPIKGMPNFSAANLYNLLLERERDLNDLSDKLFVEELQENCAGATSFFKQLSALAKWKRQPLTRNLLQSGLYGPFAVSGDTYYMEYNYKLFRWEPGDTEWYDTRLEETIRLTQHTHKKDLKLAVKGNTIYAGKRDGHLVVSHDRGNNWIDLTSALPFRVKAFNDIVIVGETVFIATDVGVAASDRGNNWGVITDSEGTNLVMEHLDVDGTTLYGVIKDTGIYRLDNGTWNQIVSEIPEKMTSLAVDGNTLYVGTQNNGMLHFNLEE